MIHFYRSSYDQQVYYGTIDMMSNEKIIHLNKI